MQHTPYLCKNKLNTYYFRYSLPRWHIQQSPSSAKRILISLMTKDVEEARVRVQALAGFTKRYLKRIRRRGIVKQVGETKTVNQVIRDYRDYIAYAQDYDQDLVYYGTPSFEGVIEILEQQLLQIEHGGLLGFVSKDLTNLDELLEKAVVLKAQLTDQKINNVIDGQLSKSSKKIGTPTIAAETTTDASVLLSKLLESYIAGEQAGVRVKTTDKMRSHIEFLIDCAGDMEVSSFTQNHMRTYRAKLDAKTRVIKGHEAAISNVTKNDHLSSCSRLFDFAIGHYNSKLENFFSDVTVKFKIKKTTKKRRVPYSKSELKLMFSHSIFSEGTYKYPYQYWAPLLALYTGSRANEISQLTVDDIVIKEGVCCISHNQNTKDKNLKTDQERLVPIHPKLIELGFVDFVELIKKPSYQWNISVKPHQLFNGLTLDKKRGGYQKNLSRWFNGVHEKPTGAHSGFKNNVGINIPDTVMKDFHSFRHTLATELDEVGVPPNIGFMITGHAVDSDVTKMNSSAGGGYRHGVSVKKMFQEICKLDFEDEIMNVKPFFDLNGEKKCRQKILAKK